MATITYQFLKTHDDILLRTLEFEGEGDDITDPTDPKKDPSGSIKRNIVGLLDINVIVEGKPSAVGETWSLIVTVNKKPIIGTVSGKIDKSGKSAVTGAYSWYV